MKTTVDLQKENSEMLIEYANGGSFTIKFKNKIELRGRGVICKYENGFYEVTTAKLNQLKKEFTWTTNF